MTYKELLESTIEFHNRINRDGVKYNIVHTHEHTIVKGKFVFKERQVPLGYDSLTSEARTEKRCENIVKSLLISGLLNYKIG